MKQTTNYVLYAKKGTLKPYRVFLAEASLSSLQRRVAMAPFNPHKIGYMSVQDWKAFGNTQDK